MVAYIWPLILVLFSNTLYQICAKSLPGSVDPFASLTVTYLVAALISVILYIALGNHSGFMNELGKMNWTSYVLGIVIAGLEVGMIFAYKAGWQASVLVVVQFAILAIIMLFVGRLIYAESITLNKAVGLVICLVGIYFINK